MKGKFLYVDNQEDANTLTDEGYVFLYKSDGRWVFANDDEDEHVEKIKFTSKKSIIDTDKLNF